MTNEKLIREFADSLANSNNIAEIERHARSHFNAATRYLHKLDEVCAYPSLDLTLPADPQESEGSRLFVHDKVAENPDNEAKIIESGYYHYPVVARVGKFVLRTMKMDVMPLRTMRHNRESAEILTDTMIAPMVSNLFERYQAVPSTDSFGSLAYYEEIKDFRLETGMCLAPPYSLEEVNEHNFLTRAVANIAILGEDFQNSLSSKLKQSL